MDTLYHMLESPSCSLLLLLVLDALKAAVSHPTLMERFIVCNKYQLTLEYCRARLISNIITCNAHMYR